jgi:hypothetical protein
MYTWNIQASFPVEAETLEDAIKVLERSIKQALNAPYVRGGKILKNSTKAHYNSYSMQKILKSKGVI